MMTGNAGAAINGMVKKCVRLSQKLLWNPKAMRPSHPLVLRRAISPLNPFWPQRCVLGGAARNAFSPHSEGAGLHVRAHEIDHRRFVQPIGALNSLERRAVFPCHFDDSGGIAGVEVEFLF